jgi:hypothetical protein
MVLVSVEGNSLKKSFIILSKLRDNGLFTFTNVMVGLFKVKQFEIIAAKYIPQWNDA